MNPVKIKDTTESRERFLQYIIKEKDRSYVTAEEQRADCIKRRDMFLSGSAADKFRDKEHKPERPEVFYNGKK